MKWLRFCILLLVLLVAFAAGVFLGRKKETFLETHIRARQFVIQATLDRFSDPIVILGDSIVEGSTLPRSLCGNAIINAGIGGTSTASDLGTMLEKSLGGKHAALIVVSLGTNDAAVSRSQETFRSSYGTLLKQLSRLGRRTAVMEIPPVEHPAINETINGYNSILPEIAEKAAAIFVPLLPMRRPHTFDGVHLNAAGYERWETTILQAAASICDSKK
jgi:lysophospholipase L1-like esterase